MQTETLRVRVLYSGRVQGVGFRATARQIAGDFRVCGFVRNLADGTVELQAQGEDAEVRGLLEALAFRMRYNIQSAARGEIAARQDETGFDIAY